MKKITMMTLVASLIWALTACGNNKGTCDICGKEDTLHNVMVNDKQMNICMDCMCDLVEKSLEETETNIDNISISANME